MAKYSLAWWRRGEEVSGGLPSWMSLYNAIERGQVDFSTDSDDCDCCLEQWWSDREGLGINKWIPF